MLNLGRLGHGDIKDRNTPTQIQFDTQQKFVFMDGGAFHSAAVTSTYYKLFGFLPKNRANSDKRVVNYGLGVEAYSVN